MFQPCMIGLAGIAEAARVEFGDRLLQEPLRASCASCGTFAVSIMSVPTFVRVRCAKCKIDLVILVSRDSEVLMATER